MMTIQKTTKMPMPMTKTVPTATMQQQAITKVKWSGWKVHDGDNHSNTGWGDIKDEIWPTTSLDGNYEEDGTTVGTTQANCRAEPPALFFFFFL